jgi:hypothetical protein
MRNKGLSCFAAGLPLRGKLPSGDVSALGLEFVGGVNIVPELFFLFYCGQCLAYLQIVFLFP